MRSEKQTKNLVILILASTYFVSVCAILYALIYVTQPMQQAPNDRDFIGLISTLLTFLTGVLSGYLTTNGVNSAFNNTVKRIENEKLD